MSIEGKYLINQINKTQTRHPKRYINQTTRSINQQLYQLISNVRILEKHLQQQQVKKESLLSQNGINRQTLQNYKNNKQLRQVRIQQLKQEFDVYRLTSKNIEECQKSMKILYAQIDNLKEDVENKSNQCLQIQMEIPQFQKLIEKCYQKRQNSMEQRKILQADIQRYMHHYPQEFDKQIPHLDNLQARLTNLLIGLQSIKMEQDKSKKQYHRCINGERQIIMKLQYEKQLIEERLKDSQKNQEIAKICQKQTNLQNTVQQMLIKQQQLMNQLFVLTRENDQEEKKLNSMLQHKESSWIFEKQNYSRQMKELKMSHSKLIYDTDYFASQTAQKKIKRQKLSSQYSLMHKLQLNLNSMQRLRSLQQRNNYLKIKIAQAKDMKQLITEQKQIVPTARFYS